MALVAHQHGKTRVRLGRVWRDELTHHFVEWSVDTMLLSDMAHAYLEGDNAGMTATDTQKNTVYYIAKQCDEKCSPEEFAIALAKHLVDKYEKISKVTVSIEETPWERLTLNGAAHQHGFVCGSSGYRTVEVSYTKDAELAISSGIKGLKVLKTTQSGFVGYVHDEFTTLPDTTDRILATSLTASWAYSSPPPSFDDAYQGVRAALLGAFFGPPEGGVYSPSVQFTLYQMAKAALDGEECVKSVKLRMPNIHFLPCKPVTCEAFENDVYVATSEPHGDIEATVAREDCPRE
ncbi:unnamed protein product [Ostreobium quekettii]|uniref:Uricase n=1 Tax=Ostreobium quekettii TaxID=121088 RepID=A0A8S1INV3_9CHLO|nr:unnamed protein product [Ostreobium quekettii]|eukprot:evm.model.scf_49.8 EVM.evm.TU.scf_49.8   scf_49:79854-83889(-)